MATIAPIGVEQGAVYEIIGPRGDRAVFNDLSDPDYVGVLTEPPGGLERAAVREVAEDLAEGDGRVHGAFWRSGLSFVLQGLVPPDGGTLDWITRQDRLLAATDALRSDAQLSWTPSGPAPAVRLLFREQQPTRLTNRRPKSFLITGVSESSGVEALLPNVATIAPSLAAVGGLSLPVTFPLTFAPSVNASVLVPNIGRRVAWPLLRIYGPCADPVITNATTGDQIVLRYALLDGEYLEVDTNPRARSVLLNGQANRYPAVDFYRTRWWGLEGGTTTDVRLGVSSLGTGAHLDIVWRDAWG